MPNVLWHAARGGNITVMTFWLEAQAEWCDTAIDINLSGEVAIKNVEAEPARRLELVRATMAEERNEYMKWFGRRRSASSCPGIKTENKIE